MTRSLIISLIGHLSLIAGLFVLALVAPMKPEPKKLMMVRMDVPPPPPPPPEPEPESEPEPTVKKANDTKKKLVEEYKVIDPTPTPTATPKPKATNTPKPKPKKTERPKKTVTPKPTIKMPESTPRPRSTPAPTIKLPDQPVTEPTIDTGIMSTAGAGWEQGPNYAGQALRLIQGNFHPSHSSPRKCTVRFRIMRDGTIDRDSIQVINSTGLTELDSSAVQALVVTAKLPELYQSFSKPYMEVDVVFNFDKTF